MCKMRNFIKSMEKEVDGDIKKRRQKDNSQSVLATYLGAGLY